MSRLTAACVAAAVAAAAAAEVRARTAKTLSWDEEDLQRK